MLAIRHGSWVFALLTIEIAANLSCCDSLLAQSSSKRPSPTRVSQTPGSPAVRRNSEGAIKSNRSDSLRVAESRDEAPTDLEATPRNRDSAQKVMRIASLSAEEVKAKQSTALRRSVTVYVPKLVNERQNVTRTIMAPVASHELRPVWSPGQGRWLTYRPTSQTMWAPRSEVVTMDVPVWRYVAETRYVEEPVVRRNFYAPIQTAPDAWAWSQSSPHGAGAQPVIPPYQPPHRPVISFLKNRPLVGRLFGGGRPVFPPAPAPIGPTTVNYQPVSLYVPNSAATVNAASGNGIPTFIAPALPTSSASGSFGGVRTFQ